jgi:hypothetical protein
MPILDVRADHPVPAAPGTGRGWRIAGTDAPEARRAENRGRLWLVGSYLLCPCHLPVFMALVASLAGGTAVGAALTASAWRLGAVLGLLYALALWRGFRHLRRAQRVTVEGEGCATGQCPSPPARRRRA